MFSSGRLVGRSREAAKADVAQLAERVLGKDEVTSSILVIGSRQASETVRRSLRREELRETDYARRGEASRAEITEIG
jgi:hypothetical protein